jgi:hypothetical protein
LPGLLKGQSKNIGWRDEMAVEIANLKMHLASLVFGKRLVVFDCHCDALWEHFVPDIRQSDRICVVGPWGVSLTELQARIGPLS